MFTPEIPRKSSKRAPNGKFSCRSPRPRPGAPAPPLRSLRDRLENPRGMGPSSLTMLSRKIRATATLFNTVGPHLCADEVSHGERKGIVHHAAVPIRAARRRVLVSTRRGKQFNTLIYAEVDPLNGATRDAV